MATGLRILCVHGVGHSEIDPAFRTGWERAIRTAMDTARPGFEATIDFLEYDDLFSHAPLTPLTYGLALARLLASAVVHGIDDGLPRSRGLAELPATVRWTAGMVAQWSTEDDLRSQARRRLLDQLKQQPPYDLICAHSLGSLIAYDTFAHELDALAGRTLMTFGSQIGHPAVRDVFAGRIADLETAREWYHLFNPNDQVLTCPLTVNAPNFSPVTTEFDVPNDPLNHDATWYLGHANTIASVWRPLAGGAQARAFASVSRRMTAAPRKADRKALIIGINSYPDPANRLEGCVNDAFLISSVLQECGFEAEEIRMVLDERATTDGILQRMHWLLDDLQKDDERVLFYSGHGAQIPAYGVTGEPDHYSESLVPVDFDWTPAHAITDRQFCELYSQLPYDAHFLAVFDCCHSGGLTRDGGPKIRGINPPDDVRHRALRWDAAEGMWVNRTFPPVNKSLHDSKVGVDYLGITGSAHRFGRSAELRTLPQGRYDSTRKRLGHQGPYLPILMEACQEEQFSYEYRHGASSYGAYTFSLAQVLREARARGRNLSYAELSVQATAKLHRLKYQQTPSLVGARDLVNTLLPWSQLNPSRPSSPHHRKTRSPRPRRRS
jgi:hypothetical protein